MVIGDFENIEFKENNDPDFYTYTKLEGIKIFPQKDRKKFLRKIYQQIYWQKYKTRLKKNGKHKRTE